MSYSIKYWDKKAEYWVEHLPLGEPTNTQYEEKLADAHEMARLSCDCGTAVAKIYNASGEFEAMYVNCGTMGTAWIS